MTDPEVDWKRVRSAFETASELPESERSTFLDRALGSESSERREVDRLLALAPESTGFLTPPPDDAVAALLSPEIDLVGKRVASYRLEKLIASGGMGVVYQAEQDVPKRQVALKMIRPSVASERAVRRFREEIENLARLRHPGIAQIYEVGVVASAAGDAPWFSLELVDGATPITEYVTRLELSTSERLGLFMRVCEAVHHGHQRGVIHCDLKPSNVLIDSGGHPKVIDFGIARAIDRDGERGATRTGEVAGTLSYMSPEQLRGETRDLDLRVDVFALGILLHEIVAGGSPLPAPSSSLLETLRQRESFRFASREVAGSRELAWIVGKAIAAERERRYETALDLARDVGRLLRHEPILAGPESNGYRIAKFVRRHRLGVASAAVIAATLIAALILTDAARVRAVAAEGVASRERGVALAQARRAETVIEFLLDLFRKADPRVSGRELTMGGALDRAVVEYDRRFAEQGDLQVVIADAIGRAYAGLGLAAEAEQELQKALTAARRHHGEDAVETAQVLTNLGRLRLETGTPAQAEEPLARADAILARLLPEDAPARLRVAAYRAMLIDAKGDRVTARDQLAKMVERMESSFGVTHRETLFALSHLAGIQHRMGDLESAAKSYRRALDGIRPLLGDEHTQTLALMSNLAMAEYFLGKREDSVAMLERVLDVRTRLLGADHPDTVASIGNLGGIHFSAQRWDDAVRCYDLGVSALSPKLPAHHPVLLTMKLNLGAAEAQRKNYERAATLAKEVHDVRKETLGPAHASTLNALGAYCDGLRGSGQLDLALEQVIAGVELASSTLGPKHPTTHSLRLGHGRTLRDLKRFEEAEVVLRECVEEYPEILKQSAMKGDPRLIENELADLYDAWGRPEEAARHRQRADEAAPGR